MHVMDEIYNNRKTSSRISQAAQNMKLVFALFFILLSIAALAQWSTQSPVPTHLDVRGVGASSEERVFIATDDDSFDNGGALFESTDGGINWIQRNIPLSLSNPFNGLFFLDNQNGWVYGNENYRTTDGGTTWTQLPFLGSTYFMKFYTPTFGIATGNFGQYISIDGGSTWIDSPNGMFEFDFTNDLVGLGIANNAIYRTSDGGSTFTPVFNGAAEAVKYLTSTLAVGIANGSFIRSENGGESWIVGASANGRQHLVAVSGDVVLAWGRTGSFPDYDDRIFRSEDGGQNWTDLGEVMPAGVNAFVVADPQSIVGSDLEGNMFHSADAGTNWNQSFFSPGQQPGYLSSAEPVFANAMTGYFGYGAGFIIKTTDGGASWFQISSGAGNSLNDVDRLPNGNLIAVGDNGTVLTNSGGTSQWILQPAVSQYSIKAVQTVSANEIVMVDELGQVFLSANGGADWTAASTVPPGLSPAEDIFFNTLQDGWVTGQGGVSLFHTSDGGDSWIPVPDFGGAYVSVDVEGMNIWANNVTGLFYRSTDNGISWIPGVIPGSPSRMQDMDFYDESIGYAVGWAGRAYRSDDGGATWQLLPTPNESDQLTDLYLVGPDELWVSTNSNVAYYSANGGQGWAVLDIGSKGFGSFSGIAANTTGDAWTVGFQGYIEHFSGPPPPPLNQPPTAAFSSHADGLSVGFTDASTDLDGSIVAWSWNFDDGFFSTGQNPSHTFDTANTYIVRLHVTDDDGDSDSTIRIITVQPNPGGIFGDFTEVTPLDSVFVTPQDEDFWVITTAPADYDSDGDIDIAVLGYYVVYNLSAEYRLVLLVNNGPSDSIGWDFSYVSVDLEMLTTGSSDMAWGDLDGDGDPDLIVGTDGATVIYRNDNGTLVMSDTNLPGYWEENSQAEFDLRSITLADFDNDSDLDILIPSVWDENNFSFKTVLMRNEGPNGTGGVIFAEADSVFAPTSHANSTWADFDNDQDLDLLLVSMAPNTEEGFIRRYRNDGNGAFVAEDILGTLSIEHGEAQWGDYDADGDLDILAAGNIREIDGSYNLALRIYRNDNENYVPVEVIPCVPCEGWFDLTAATWADYDSDGDMDILLAGNYNSGSNIEGRARIYTNSLGIFTADSANTLPSPRASGDRGGTFSWLDLDGDRDLDYFIAGQYFVPGGNGLVEAQMHAYLNDVAGLNNAPLAPGGLGATLQGDDAVRLSWIVASDDHTPAPALTYDLGIFRDNIPVTLPVRFPEPGNVSAVTEWLLTGLQIGHYKWTLRAVDAAYIGSPLASGEFNVGNSAIAVPANNLYRGYALAQNYPNPFDETTTIQYQIPEDVYVSLTVYNSIGRKVLVLVNKKQVAGIYAITFPDQRLPAGLYFYSLRSGNYVETRKMLIAE